MYSIRTTAVSLKMPSCLQSQTKLPGTAVDQHYSSPTAAAAPASSPKSAVANDSSSDGASSAPAVAAAGSGDGWAQATTRGRAASRSAREVEEKGQKVRSGG